MNVQAQILNPRRRLVRQLTGPLCTVVALALLLVASNLKAQPASHDSGLTYKSFDVIAKRNIFDPNEHSIRPPTPAPRTPDVFALVGTMSYSKGKFAFFDGTKTDYKKVLEPGATIAGYRIKDVTPKDVTLAAGGKEVILTVGSQLTK